MSAREVGVGRWAGPQDTFGFELDTASSRSGNFDSERRLCATVCVWMNNESLRD